MCIRDRRTCLLTQTSPFMKVDCSALRAPTIAASIRNPDYRPPYSSPMPFDATAWLSNNAAMRLSFACKGLWLDMLCCMWVSIERGVMMKPIGGAYTVDELEALYGSGTKELIESLINAELLSVRNDGALYNADMVKMESIRVKPVSYTHLAHAKRRH